MIEVIPRPATIPKLTFIYAKMQALGEPARMLMRYADIPYEDVYPWDYYGKSWREGAKQATPFGKVPVMVVDGHTAIDQSGSIQRYLGTLTETCPAEPLLAAQADALCENAGELFVVSNPVANFARGKKFSEKVAEFHKIFLPRLKNFDRALSGFPDGPFFMGAKPMYCDFTIFHHFQIAQILIPTIFDEFPAVGQFMVEMEKLPGVGEYLKERPQLVEVGTRPSFLVNGERVRLGFE